jgi:succinoglycan biosynthesis protein ExoM
MPVRVDVCVCTYRRASLADTLGSIARLELPSGIDVRVIIADNDDVPSAQALVRSLETQLGLDCLYIHAPARNIAVARNACLDAADAPLIAFIDDDETATESWLANLISSQRSSGATIVFGPIRAIYPAEPAWLHQADLHSIKPAILKTGQIDTGYTSNVLIYRAALPEPSRAYRFDPSLGRSGGEDTAFFHQLYTYGAELAFCPDALVNEIVTPGRANLVWLLKRSFRSGQTHGQLLIAHGRGRMTTTAAAIAKLGYCLVGAGLWATSPSGWRRFLVRGALHAGVVANCSGLRDLQLY